MPVNNDPREVRGYEIAAYNNNEIKINIKSDLDYKYGCVYVKNPTGNCQLASIQHIQNVMPILDKYKFRDLMIKLRKEHFCKRLLMLDVNKQYVDRIKSYVSPKTIANQMTYISSNGSEMTIFFLKLSVIRQMKIPS